MGERKGSIGRKEGRKEWDRKGGIVDGHAGKQDNINAGKERGYDISFSIQLLSDASVLGGCAKSQAFILTAGGGLFIPTCCSGRLHTNGEQ